jgi:hypothetical protein
MKIELHSIDLKNHQPFQEGPGIGYWCEFESPLARGSGLFIPRGPFTESYEGKSIQVQVMAESISDVQPLSDEEAGAFQFVPLGSPGDYRAEGRVVSLVWLDDDQEDAMLEVLVGEDLLSFPASSLDEAPIEFGGWVSFTIHQLVLVEVQSSSTT